MILLAAALSIAVCPEPPARRSNCTADGDTVWIEREKVRIADIDAPELQGQCEDERRRARRARARLAELLSSGNIVITRTGQDRYKRTLVIITRDGRSVGDMLVGEGLARTWSGRREPWC